MAVDNKSYSAKQSIYINKSVWHRMIRHCQKEAPLEACGILSGKRLKKCEFLWKMRNIKNSRTSFEMSQEQIDRTFQLIGDKGQKLTGIYHSHPTGDPFPSRQDIDNAFYPEAAYFIISLAGSKPRIKCFRLNDKVIPLQIKIIE